MQINSFQEGKLIRCHFLTPAEWSALFHLVSWQWHLSLRKWDSVELRAHLRTPTGSFSLILKEIRLRLNDEEWDSFCSAGTEGRKMDGRGWKRGRMGRRKRARKLWERYRDEVSKRGRKEDERAERGMKEMESEEATTTKRMKNEGAIVPGTAYSLRLW